MRKILKFVQKKLKILLLIIPIHLIIEKKKNMVPWINLDILNLMKERHHALKTSITKLN